MIIGAGGQTDRNVYFVDVRGNVLMPGLGSINVLGKTKEQTIEAINKILANYVPNALVHIRFINFRITIQGEVARPGVFTINSERISLPEALTLAGDLTIYGKRKNILLLRENNGTIKTTRIDLTNAEFLNSEFYYLQQNDVLYIEPNKTD